MLSLMSTDGVWLLIVVGVLALAVLMAFLPIPEGTDSARRWVERRGYRVVSIRRIDAHLSVPSRSLRQLWHVDKYEAVLEVAGVSHSALIELRGFGVRVLWRDGPAE
jgi:hypothetical protein